MPRAVSKARQPETNEGTIWSSSQAYTLAVACLLLGVALGYLLRGSAPVTSAADAAAPVVARNTGPAQLPGMGGMPGSAMTPEQIDQAAAPFLQAIQRNPKDAEAIARLGNLYYDAQQYPKAIQRYAEALKLRPENPDVRTDMGTAIWYSGRADEAIAEFEKSLSYKPDHAGALFNMGIVKWQGKHDVKGAMQAWEKLLRVNPDYAARQNVRQLMAQAQEQTR